MQIFLNNISAVLMMWETNPIKRKDSIISFYLSDKSEINEKDVIVGEFSENGVSAYQIKKIIELRPGAVKKNNYITASVSWSKKSCKSFVGLDLSKTNVSFQKLIG